MDRFGRALAQIERRLVADDPVLTEAFALREERCAEAPPSLAPCDHPRWRRHALGVLLGLSLLAAIPCWPRCAGRW